MEYKKSHLDIFQRAIDSYLEAFHEIPENGSVCIPIRNANIVAVAELAMNGDVKLEGLAGNQEYWLTQKGADFARKMYEEQKERVA